MPTDWEKAYHRKRREMEVLPRSGLHSRVGSKREWTLTLWHKTDDLPDWLPDFVLDTAERATAYFNCLVHNHTPMTEMDGHTIVCAICHRTLGHHHRAAE